jgi:hypothetical protein
MDEDGCEICISYDGVVAYLRLGHTSLALSRSRSLPLALALSPSLSLSLSLSVICPTDYLTCSRSHSLTYARSCSLPFSIKLLKSGKTFVYTYTQTRVHDTHIGLVQWCVCVCVCVCARARARARVYIMNVLDVLSHTLLAQHKHCICTRCIFPSSAAPWPMPYVILSTTTPPLCRRRRHRRHSGILSHMRCGEWRRPLVLGVQRHRTAGHQQHC